MSVYLEIGGIDVSGFITENEYSAAVAPVFDEENSFVNIYGETVRARVGREITLSAVLRDVDDSTAGALSSALEERTVSVRYTAPDLRQSDFAPLGFALKLDRYYRGEKFWTAELTLRAFEREVGL